MTTQAFGLLLCVTGFCVKGASLGVEWFLGI